MWSPYVILNSHSSYLNLQVAEILGLHSYAQILVHEQWLSSETQALCTSNVRALTSVVVVVTLFVLRGNP